MCVSRGAQTRNYESFYRLSISYQLWCDQFLSFSFSTVDLSLLMYLPLCDLDFLNRIIFWSHNSDLQQSLCVSKSAILWPKPKNIHKLIWIEINQVHQATSAQFYRDLKDFTACFFFFAILFNVLTFVTDCSIRVFNALHSK